MSSRVLVWCLLAPSRGGVLLLGETWSAVLTLKDPCLFYVQTATRVGLLFILHLARNPIPIIRPAGCAPQLPGPGM